jgi:putative methyltransferase (TIGR04325 family)
MLRTLLSAFVPPIARKAARRLAGAPGAIQFTGDYRSWAEARAASAGYDLPAILEKQVAAASKVRDGVAPYERDTVVFSEIEHSFPLLAALLHAAAADGNRLSVLDFGGALGSSYYQNRGLLGHIAQLRWSIVEQPHFVDAGRKMFEDDRLRFYESIGRCLAAERPNVLLLSSVLQYLEAPFEFAAGLAQLGIAHLVVDRTPMTAEAPTRLTVQQVPPSIYRASYPCWIFNAAELRSAFAGAWDRVFEFEAHVGTVIDLGDAKARYGGFFLRRKAT